ncbi:lytic murein transglycosylase [Aliiroseovarius sp. PTFE2010]|uniref:lytic murein transglycosylase n=1 Tax=Aliiroseovarius sp. PTFE2010 TaxID=3417190 RepID=UPI003CEE18FF
MRLAALALILSSTAALAAPCGNDASGFLAWKQAFAKEAAREGIGEKGLAALTRATYAARTIAADRNQKSFKYSLEKFMQVRGADAIVAQGRRNIAKYPDFYGALERIYGVPAGIIVAIHGMETGFGRFMGDSHVLSATTTLAYDCRRPDFFRPHLLATLKLIDRGDISANATGAKHGELGHTQFLPGNILAYGVDGDGNGQVDLTGVSDALSSTANFLRSKGWQPGKGWQEGQPNFRVIKEWNAASVYQKAIAIIAARIEA